MEHAMGQAFVYEQRPQRVYWEITRACDLACRHCRAKVVPDPDPAELITAEGRRLLEQVTGHCQVAGRHPKSMPNMWCSGSDEIAMPWG